MRQIQFIGSQGCLMGAENNNEAQLLLETPPRTERSGRNALLSFFLLPCSPVSRNNQVWRFSTDLGKHSLQDSIPSANTEQWRAGNVDLRAKGICQVWKRRREPGCWLKGATGDEKGQLTTGGSYTGVRVEQRKREANPGWMEIQAAERNGGLQAECWPWRWGHWI